MTEPTYLSVTRAAYDAVAVDYAEQVKDLLATKPLDRAMLAVLAEMVAGGPVAELGCGPGRVTTHLHDLGVDVFGSTCRPAWSPSPGGPTRTFGSTSAR